MANKLFQAFIDTAKTIAGYPITVANAVFMRDGSTLDEFSENIPHREDNEDTDIEVPNIDADMLNGHPADYYSKQSDLSALNNSVTQVNNKIGNTDISTIGDGTVTGGLDALNSNLVKKVKLSQYSQKKSGLSFNADGSLSVLDEDDNTSLGKILLYQVSDNNHNHLNFTLNADNTISVAVNNNYIGKLQVIR